MNRESIQKKILHLFLMLGIVLSAIIIAKLLTSVSVGANDLKVDIEANLQKYINYELSNQDKGTLLQYDVKMGIEYEEDEEDFSIKDSALVVGVNQIDEKYPYDVKVISKSTEATNGKKEVAYENYEYDSSTGIIKIIASNQDEQGALLNAKPFNDSKDEYVIICYYDTYVEEDTERELDVRVLARVTLTEEDRIIESQNEFKGKVNEDIGELTSVEIGTADVYNGYIKSNIINNTDYSTEYIQTDEIEVSKKDVCQKIELTENNTFLKEYINQEEVTVEELGNGEKLVYKSTKVRQNDIIKLLGEEGFVEIYEVLGEEEKLVEKINKDTKFDEDGTKTIYYENEPEKIIIKTSDIQNEGILKVENTKEIKSTMLDIDIIKIKTEGNLIGINEETTIKEDEELIEDIKVFENTYEGIVEIKDSQTNIDMKINNVEWTNKQQNEVTFDVYANSNTVKDNMLKNPTIKIELPNEVEKVILGESSVVYANGLQLQNPYLETNENGNIVIVANLVGEQTTYDENTLGLITDVKISATVILKKDIETSKENVNLIFTNNYTLDGETEVKNKSQEIQIQNYKEDTLIVQEQASLYSSGVVATSLEDTTGLEVEVTPVRGDTIIADGDTIYEGEYIKYNVKVTNTSENQMDNVTIVGNIPEGTVYGELEADYYNALGEYKYNFNEDVKEKTIEIGSLKAGESYNTFYEVKVKDLEEGQDEKEITTIIKTYVGETEATSYEIANVVKLAEVQTFLSANLDNARDRWNYSVKLNSEEAKKVTIKLQVPKEYELELLVHDGQSINLEDNVQISEDNIITTTVELTGGAEQEWLFEGTIDALKLEKQTEESKVELEAVATIITENNSYKSNENRIIFEYESVNVTMTSNREGEKIKYDEEIEYEITITNTGRTNLNDPAYSTTSIKVTDYLPENVKPVSMSYEYWEREETSVDEENGIYETDWKYNKVEKTEDISGIYTNENGNKLPNIELSLIIPYEESSTIKIKATAGFVYEKTKVENSATVTGDRILTKTSNTIAHIILPYNYEESDNSDDSDDSNNPVNPDDSDNSGDSTDEKDKHSISGVAWLDENEDGQRQASERLLSGNTVMLVDTKNSSLIKSKVTTDENGAYKFSDLETGSYIVVFKYDTDVYSLTEYKKSGVSSEENSDAISETITIQGEETKVGLTDIITLDASLSNIDIGLVKNKICDIKLDKYISKVVVKTASQTKEQTYENARTCKSRN